MTMKIFHLSTFLFAFVLAASALCFDFPALAGNTPSQNANSSTTAAPNANAGTTTRRGGRRNRGRAAAATPEASTPATDSAAMPAAQTTPADTSEQTDLSGTYTGTMDCPDAGVSGETTLTITGNQFTLADGKSGRIVASTTRGYTGMAMQFGEATAATPTQAATVPTIVSMRAKKSGNRLTLTSIADSGHVCSFTPAGTTRTRRTRARAATPAQPAEPATPTETPATPATPAEPATPPASAGPMPPAAPPAPARRGRRGRRGNQNTNTNANANPNRSTNDNTGVGNTNAKPTPTPAVPRN
jgi:hypothetical protein